MKDLASETYGNQDGYSLCGPSSFETVVYPLPDGSTPDLQINIEEDENGNFFLSVDDFSGDPGEYTFGVK